MIKFLQVLWIAIRSLPGRQLQPVVGSGPETASGWERGPALLLPAVHQGGKMETVFCNFFFFLSFWRTAWVQKIKAASELYIETEKKKREKAYLGTARGAGALILCGEVCGQENTLMSFVSPLLFHHSSLAKSNRHWETDGQYCWRHWTKTLQVPW